MPETGTSLLDWPAYPSDGYAKLADRIASLLGTRNDVLLVQAEAVVALEAVATSLSSPAIQALNVVTSPYGAWFGQWLGRGGAAVTDVIADPGMPISVEAFSRALSARPQTNLVAIVHAESASGILNPLPEIADIVRKHGALLVVDAVASVGGHALDVDALGIDIAVIGAQKALGGPAGVSALSVSKRAWTVAQHPGAPTRSILSLLDLKHGWLDTGRGVLAGMPSALEFFALEAALDRVDAEEISASIARHEHAAAATRTGVRALGATLWIVDDVTASNLTTAVRLPDGLDAVASDPECIKAGISPGVGVPGVNLIRLNHTGQSAARGAVLAGILALGRSLGDHGLSVDTVAAERAIRASYRT